MNDARPNSAMLTAWLRLAQGLSRSKARQWLKACGHDVQRAASELPPLDEEGSKRIAASLRWLDQAPDRHLLTLADADYPGPLLHGPDPPLALFLEGQRSQLGRPAMAIVGSRHATPNGLELAEQFGEQIAAAGWVVVSGLALGIDGAAHVGALRAGSTWAVLGCGLDQIYPPRHRALAQRIRADGLLISEYPPGTPPLPAQFPVRNRLIAALSQGCLVVEAALRSGSLITARLAAEAGREVFALPGPIRSLQAQGCHELIQQGAKLVQSLQDILDELPPPAPAPRIAAAPAAAPEEDPLLLALGHEATGLDKLQSRLGWATGEVLARMLELELAGRVQRLPGDRFVRVFQGGFAP